MDELARRSFDELAPICSRLFCFALLDFLFLFIFRFVFTTSFEVRWHVASPAAAVVTIARDACAYVFFHFVIFLYCSYAHGPVPAFFRPWGVSGIFVIFRFNFPPLHVLLY